MGSRIVVIDDNSRFHGFYGYVCSWRMVEVDFQDDPVCEAIVSLENVPAAECFYGFQIKEVE